MKTWITGILFLALAVVGAAQETWHEAQTPQPRERLDALMPETRPDPTARFSVGSTAFTMERFVVEERMWEDLKRSDVERPERRRFTFFYGGRIWLREGRTFTTEIGLWPSIDESDYADLIHAEISEQAVKPSAKLALLQITW